MTEKINRFIKEYKNQTADFAKIKAELVELSEDPESAVQANSLLALLFGEVKQGICESRGQDSFLVIINGRILNPGSNFEKENILIYKDRIIATKLNLPDSLPQSAKSLFVIDAKNLVITPGLIDQHIHGGYGCNFNDSSVKEMIHFANNLPRHGITSILPTVMTAPMDLINEQINRIRKAKEQKPSNSTKFLGIHLEGPYLSSQYKGIQPEKEILSPAIESFKKIEAPEIKIVSYAPELDKNYRLTKYLANKGIIPSAAHTNATAEEIKKAVGLGLKQVTHLFNAMTPLHHRNPGVIGEALTNNDIYVEVIADGLHLDPIIMDIVYRTKPESKVIFISDSLPLNHADTESIVFGGQKIFKKGFTRSNSFSYKAVNADGTLAGSLIFLDYTARNLQELRLESFSRLLMYSSYTIAQNLGRIDLGYIDKNKIADLVLWDINNNYEVKTTIINGQIAFKS